jgi:predicted secreted protein
MPIRTTLFSAALAALLAICVGSAEAGDAAARRIIGFSPDGAYFAFEQYGVRDWSESHSGWSEIAIIDTRTDQFLGGKPILVVDEKNGEMPLKQARAQAAAQAAPLLAKYAVAARGERTQYDKFTFPDDMVAYADIWRVEAASLKTLGQLQLDTILADSAEDCTASLADSTLPGDKAGKALGFSLKLQGFNNDTLKLLHQDKSVPQSRDCPLSYSLSEVYEFTPKGRPTVIAVLVQRFSQGYEGHDRRFISVTGQEPVVP